MPDEPRVQELLDELLDREATPEEVCSACPELLPVVRKRWRDICQARAKLDVLLPISTHGLLPRVPPEELPLPQVPGYEVEEVLGYGGMGVVFRARHLRLGRLVALKMTLAGAYASPSERERFRREAEAVAALRHPNLVQVYDAGECAGRPYFTMELMEGGSLAQGLAGTPQPTHEAAALLATLAEAVQVAHEGGIVHRDLKPANILLTADGMPKIADFGLARHLKSSDGLTLSGIPLGTPSYMAPEQARGQSRVAGPAVDVYALGAILYELLTGRPPFRAETPAETVLQVINQEPVSPARLNAKVPRDLETVCLKCLQKEPARRYASAGELASDLRRYQAGEPICARPVGSMERTWKWAKRRPALAALLGVVLLALVSLTLLSADLVVARNDAEQKRKTAEEKEAVARKEADKAMKARDFLVSIFELSDARTQTSTLTPRQILDDAEKRIARDFAVQPELRAELQTAIDGVYAKITQNAPLAMLLEVRGKVQLQSSRSPRPQAAPQALLYAGDRLSLADDAQVRLVVLSDLHQERLRPGSEATVRRKGCEPVEAVSERNEDILMTFVRLPKGTLYLGWGSAEDDARTIAKTEIKQDFEIAVHDVTQGQWQAVMGENPSYFSRFGGGRNEVRAVSDEELKLFPVESISWDDAQTFLKKLNEKEAGRGYLYRLPSEAEWEYACRGGTTSLEECSHHFFIDRPTDDLSSRQANFNGNYPFGEAPKGPNLLRTTRVGAYPSNKLGLCDMHGNVWQWCEDLFHPKGSERVFRGGGWYFHGTDCRAAKRGNSLPAHRGSSLGFRLARVPYVARDLAELPDTQVEAEAVRAAWEKLLGRDPPDHDSWYGYAELCLFLGREDDYRRARRELLERFGATTNPFEAERTARACLLLPATGNELRQAVFLADRAAAVDRLQYASAYPWFLFAKGLAEYRQGRFEEAIAIMRSDASRVLGPSPALVIAMALHQVGQTDEARKTLASAVLSYDWSEEQVRDIHGFIIHALRREADGLILPDSLEKPSPDE